jgi:hypothetical protein
LPLLLLLHDDPQVGIDGLQRLAPP